MKVPKKFTQGDNVVAPTVGDLINLLSELPKDLPTSGWPEREVLKLTVYNISLDNPHLGFELDSPDYE